MSGSALAALWMFEDRGYHPYFIDEDNKTFVQHFPMHKSSRTDSNSESNFLPMILPYSLPQLFLLKNLSCSIFSFSANFKKTPAMKS